MSPYSVPCRASCVGLMLTSRVDTIHHPHPLTLMDGLPVELGSGTEFSIRVSQQYRLIEAPAPLGRGG